MLSRFVGSWSSDFTQLLHSNSKGLLLPSQLRTQLSHESLGKCMNATYIVICKIFMNFSSERLQIMLKMLSLELVIFFVDAL